MSKEIGGPRPPSDGEVIDRLRVVLVRGQRRLRLAYTDDNLSPTQLEVLAMVVRRGPLRLAEVASLEGINPTMLSRIVAKLEEAQLVTRVADANDGRVVHVAATDQGRGLYEVIHRQRTQALALALESLSSHERQELRGALPALEKLVASLQLAPE
ncbi:MAG: MarR family transcriptional regulator [Acidobacteriota bacterium]|nr:MarR family transcriptional regulator [Acidobacteriota bacterium]MDE3030092.1 MarR family transcriptional regulator [Acidobacteriota bacterium]MDE3092602.1 MarR family transcriptional regulator [Acidobacteriota bacterium]MDE3146367.1 MarR family transcriptional regulator [Acidobacteriota bacterium]